MTHRDLMTHSLISFTFLMQSILDLLTRTMSIGKKKQFTVPNINSSEVPLRAKCAILIRIEK